MQAQSIFPGLLRGSEGTHRGRTGRRCRGAGQSGRHVVAGEPIQHRPAAGPTTLPPTPTVYRRFQTIHQGRGATSCGSGAAADCARATAPERTVLLISRPSNSPEIRPMTSPLANGMAMAGSRTFLATPLALPATCFAVLLALETIG